jgi:uncharacterized membrane protein
MKHLLVALGVLGGTVLSGTAANAQNYPWCAQYGGRMGGSQNCGFSTYEQCQAALSGNGGFCNRNTQYSGGGGSGPSYHYRHRRHHPND